MPLAFRREAPPHGRVPMLEERLRIGRDGENDLVVADRRVSRLHARVRLVKGEVVISAEPGALLFVNGKKVPFFALRPRDRVDLLPPDATPPQRLTFENRLHGTFVAPGTSLVEAWLAHPAYLSGGDGPERYGIAAATAPAGHATLPGVDPDTGQRLVVHLGPALGSAAEVERLLRVAARLAGAPHPALAHVLDVAAFPGREGPRVWTAMAFVEGEGADARLAAGPTSAAAVLRMLTPVAYGLAWMHRRGLVHRDVSPANVRVRPDGRGVLLDFDQTRTLGTAVAASRGVIGTPGYVAPEEVLEGGPTLTTAVDVYGLAAVAYALLTGRPPAEGIDTLEAVARAVKAPPRPRDLGVEVPPDLEDLLVDGLSSAPGGRPSAADFARRLEAVRAVLSVEAG